MSSSVYTFLTHWRLTAQIEEVAEILNEPLRLPEWWPSVYLNVNEIEPPNEDRVGAVIDLYTKGWLPYTLRWRFRVDENEPPHRFVLSATGDFEGRGVWTLSQEGDSVDVTYDWQVKAKKPLLRRLSFLLKPFFSANHHWAMAKGEESIKLELLRRRARTPEEAAKVPPPPPATFVWS
jgi:hypothetical protein